MKPKMQKRKITLSISLILSPLLWLVLAAGGCRKEPSRSEADRTAVTDAFKKYTGQYILEPTAAPTTLFLNRDGGMIMREEGAGIRRGSFQFSPSSLRIFLTLDESTALRTSPLGVFLLSEYDPLGWPGRWDGETRMLVRPAGNPPTSGR